MKNPMDVHRKVFARFALISVKSVIPQMHYFLLNYLIKLIENIIDINV